MAAIPGENTTVITYRLSGATAPCALRMRPLVAGRDYHTLRRAAGPVPRFAFDAGVLATEPLALGARLFLSEFRTDVTTSLATFLVRRAGSVL